jgi:hypothetical protein
MNIKIEIILFNIFTKIDLPTKFAIIIIYIGFLFIAIYLISFIFNHN